MITFNISKQKEYKNIPIFLNPELTNFQKDLIKERLEQIKFLTEQGVY